MKMTENRWCVIGAGIGLTLAGMLFGTPTADAGATPGHYTFGGNVRVTLATAGGCATATWPTGYTSVVCGTDQVVQYGITPGDQFGASVTSYSGAGVSCRVTDMSTGDVIWSDSAYPGYVANCLRTANR